MLRLVFLIAVLFATPSHSCALEWYLDCKVIKKLAPPDDHGGTYKSIRMVIIYMCFNNAGGNNEEYTTIKYVRGQNEDGPTSPLSLFNIVRFEGRVGNLGSRGTRISWTGSEPRVFQRGTVMKGELLETNEIFMYREALMQRRKMVSYLEASCVLNNPN